MTKMKLLFLTVLGLVTISGCAAPSATPESTTIESTISSSVSQQVATITLKIDGEEIELSVKEFELPSDEENLKVVASKLLMMPM